MLKRLISGLVSRPQPAGQAAGLHDPDAAGLLEAQHLLDAGRIAEALEAAVSLSARSPDRAAPCLLAARCLLRLGRPADAADQALAALRRNAPGVDAQVTLARAYFEQGLHEDAILAMRQAEERDPEDAAFWNEYGVLHLKLGNMDHASVMFRRAATLAPKMASPWINLAIVEQSIHGARGSLPHLRRAIECDSDNGLAWSNYGLALRDAELTAEAIGALRRAAALRPAHAQTRVNLATVLLDDGGLEEAEQQFRQALALEPGSVTALVGLGQVLQQRGDLAGAAAAFEAALLSDPDSALARSARGELAIWSRRFADGWDDYEARLADAQMRRFPFPRWDGQAPPDGTLLVHAEQGIGDMILFASCFPELASLSQVVLEVPERLVPIFARSFPRAKVVPYAGNEMPRWLDSVPPIAAAIPAGSLMRLFRRSEDAFPASAGYLTADAERTARWRARLAALPGRLKVGISWRGGFVRTGAQARSIDLDAWRPVLSTPGVDFVSLQYTRDAADALAALRHETGIDVHHWQDAIDDYEETASLVAGLDLVITVCTAAAHLSGALGRPTWILAPVTPSWRYLGQGETLPWYPSARVFRQARGGTWAEVLEQVAATLAGRLGIPVPSASPSAPPAPAASCAVPELVVPAAHARALAMPQAPDDFARAERLVRQGQVREAIEVLEAFVDAEPGNGRAYAALVHAYMAAGDREAAADCLTLALHHDPDNVDALWTLCEVNEALGRVDAAIVPLERLVAMGGGAKVRGSLARLYYRARRYGDAERAAQAVVADHPDTGEGLDVLGLARIAQEDYEGAIEPLERWLKLRPSDLVAPQSLAAAYIHRARFTDAAALLGWVLSREPNNYYAAWNLAQVQLAYRQYEEGWRNYERRRHLPERKQITGNVPRWRGQPLEGKTLLVLGEQGLGDQIMFASCLADVLRMGATVILTCERRLVPLFARSFPTVRVHDEARTRNEDVRDADYEILSGSLPVAFRGHALAFPRHSGYLAPDPARVAHWRERLRAMDGRPKLALSWRGGTAHTRTRLRSLSMDDVARLVRAVDATFVSLQYGDVAADLADLRDVHGIALPHFPEVIPDYDETAALVSALDGVVSVCTSLVHLSGALGKRCAVLVPSVPEWRYGIAGDDMPWYPSVRLFRQERDQPWATVVERLAAEYAGDR